MLDEPLALRVRGAGGAPLVWQARFRDDDGLVWRARADGAEALDGAWRGKAEHAALASLRPVLVDVRAESPDGRSAARTVSRRLVGAGVRVRRWRDEVRGTLFLPAGVPSATVLLEGASPAAALLASHGALVLAFAGGDRDAALARLAAVPGAVAEPVALAAQDVPVPPGAPGGDRMAWEALLARLSSPTA